MVGDEQQSEWPTQAGEVLGICLGEIAWWYEGSIRVVWRVEATRRCRVRGRSDNEMMPALSTRYFVRGGKTSVAEFCSELEKIPATNLVHSTYATILPCPPALYNGGRF
jgi:hypothetical protein